MENLGSKGDKGAVIAAPKIKMKDSKFFRFQNAVRAIIDCDNCLLQKQCFAQADETPEEILPSCEETLFHYVETGDFLEVEKK